MLPLRFVASVVVRVRLDCYGVAPMATKRARGGSLADTLQQLFDAERTVRAVHDDLAASDPGPLLEAIAAAVSTAKKERREEEAGLRFVRLSALLAEQTGDRAVDLLIDILGCDVGEGRYAAGEALTELAFDRFKEVALGVERALTRLPANSPALVELPFVLVEVPEPGVAKLLELFLSHQNAEVVAAAIEAAAEVGDPAIARALEKLTKDPRLVSMDDDEGESAEVPLGKLASEALELLVGSGD